MTKSFIVAALVVILIFILILWLVKSCFAVIDYVDLQKKENRRFFEETGLKRKERHKRFGDAKSKNSNP